ncbi:MAG: carbohydrate kinase [Planctomycetaceae bacterium]
MPQGPTIPIVVGLGELLWDCFADSRRPGGAPANVAFQAGQLGCRGIVCSRVGDDADGDELVAFLEQQGLTTEFVQRDGQLPTGRVTVDASVPGSPQYVIHENVAWDALRFDAATLWQQADAVCFGSLAQRDVRSRETVHRCLQATRPACLRVFDANLRQEFYDRETIERSLQAAGVVKLNGDEATVLRELLALPTGDDRAFASSLRERFEVALVCITRGAEGCLLADGDDCVDLPGTEVNVVDAVGAGDAFTAALIDARLHGLTLQTTAEFANAVGGLVATRSGAMPVLRDEFAALKQRFRSRSSSN